ncbi:LOW QUALITY PROTEIN: hypothetical protein OSB04_031875 [Centaurea solstitialis]|uniref:Uncharacterized protein n=1 Tax=Centaurea solstitialis TaxID=347529 RepID=A0AA38STW6_9ASTR|nr:LOW QUALITY PROTEIN: hypothetical protein OSB04_031875 [Centaurea solstitialis]
MIARPMIMKSKLPVFAWGHAILHTTTLIRTRPTSYNASSPFKNSFWSGTKYFPTKNYWLCDICSNCSTTTHKDGTSNELENQNEISWNELSYLDPQTKQCELKVQKIIQLQRLANQLPDTFTDLKKSHVPAANAPIKINVPKGQNNKSRARQKRGRPLDSKDKNPRKKKEELIILDGHIEVDEMPEKSPEETLDMLVPEEPQVPENKEISINYSMSRKVWNRDKIDLAKIERRNAGRIKREVFGPVVRTLKTYRVLMGITRNKVVRYKMAQGFSQRPITNYEETYFPVVDATTSRYLISLVIQE